MYHETIQFIFFICNKKIIHEEVFKFKLQIMQLKTSITILELKKYFLRSSALQTLVPPNSYLFLRLS